MIVQFVPKNAIISRMKFAIGNLEYWVFPFAKSIPKKEYYPPFRKHLFGGWFWKSFKCKE